MHPAFRSVDACRVLWQLEGYTLKPSKHKTEAGYAGVAPVGKRWKAQIWSAEQRKAVHLGSFDRPEQAALAIAKHRGQLAGQPMEESVYRPTEARLLCPTTSPLHAPSLHPSLG